VGGAVVIGQIKHTSKNQDYGFVTGEDQVDYFLHVLDTPDKNIPLVGTRISFDVTTGKDGRPRALNATPIDPVLSENYIRTY
jgi:cold shock CspA family protein